MLEAQFSGVQGLSLEPLQGGLGGKTQSAGARFEPHAIDRITQEGMTDMCHMHPNLMRAAGFERKPQQTGPGFPLRRAEGFEQVVVGDGVTSVRRSRDGNFRAVESAARQRGINAAAGRAGRPQTRAR